MSTKTLRKRIALVAVSAMGFGLLTSVSANAADMAAAAEGDFTIAGTAGAAGVCDVDTTAGSQWIVVNKNVASSVTFTAAAANKGVKAGDTLKLSVVSGPAVISSSSVSGDGSKETWADTTNITDETLSLTGTGTVKVNYSKTVSGVSTVIETFSVYSVTACDTGAYSSTTSVSFLDDTNATALDATSAAAVTGDDSTAGTKTYSQTTYIKLWLTDKYGHAVDTTNSFVQASATNGAYVGIDGAGVADTALTTTSPNDAVVYVSLPAETYKPVSTTVTVKFNGTVVATRTVTFTGAPAKVVVSDVATYVDNGSTDTIKFKVLDAAGNQLAGWTPVAGSSTSDVNGASVTAFGGASSATALQTATLTAGANEGASATTIRVKLDDGTYVVSDPIKFTTTTNVMDIFTIGTDKATYAPGEVVTVTITGKNAKGNPVADGTSIGDLTWVGSGLTKVTADPTDNDTSTDGAWVYKFYASTTEGNYGYSLKSDAAATTTTAQTGTFAVKVSSSGVSNAEVLAAIVKLIASINKQITALQKLLTKKK